MPVKVTNRNRCSFLSFANFIPPYTKKTIDRVMTKIKLLLLSILSGTLLALPFLNMAPPICLFFAFIPILWIEEFLTNEKKAKLSFAILVYSYLAFLVWNSLSTWWVYNATKVFTIVGISIFSFLYCLLFYVFWKIKTILGKKTAYISLVFIWTALEYFFLNAEISWPWLSLGNGFSFYPKWVQWYEYTGVLGGTFWIIAINILLYKALHLFLQKKYVQAIRYISFAFLSFVLPLVFSFVLYNQYTEQGKTKNFVVIQPNIDPYNEKFSNMPVQMQIQKMIDLARNMADSTTDFIVFPETAIPSTIWEENLNQTIEIIEFRKLLQLYPKAKIIIGATTARVIQRHEPIPATARKFVDANMYYNRFNTALLIDTSMQIETYHKSKLVVGVEKMPYPVLFKFLENFALDLGGVVGSLGTQEERIPLKGKNDTTQIATAICYESVYGEFVGQYLLNKADFIAIITNDGWWGDTPGYRQHMSFARLRAIETRRSIARSANTGTSCFINQRGDILQATKWWEANAIKESLCSNDKLTFYTIHGDYIGRIAQFFSILLLCYTLVIYIKNKALLKNSNLIQENNKQKKKFKKN